MEKKQIPVKNYIILAIIIVSTVFITFHLAKKYNIEKDYYKEGSPLYKVLYELKIEELDNYLLENPNTVIYIVDGNYEETLVIDRVIKKIVLEKDLTNEIIVIDATNNMSIVAPKLNTILNEKLKSNKDLLEQTNILIVKERKIVDILTPKTKNEETIINFLLKNEIM